MSRADSLVQQKLTQYCKGTISQLKKNEKKKDRISKDYRTTTKDITHAEWEYQSRKEREKNRRTI